MILLTIFVNFLSFFIVQGAQTSDDLIPASPPPYLALLPCSLPQEGVNGLLTKILQTVNSINDKIPPPSSKSNNKANDEIGKSVKLEDIGGGQLIHVAVVNNIDWFQAMKNCKALGLKLVSLENKEKNERIQSYLSSHGFHGYYWTSGIRLDNTWLWSAQAEVFTYKNWSSSQPENGVEYCMLVRYYYWADTRCNKPHAGYICEP